MSKSLDICGEFGREMDATIVSRVHLSLGGALFPPCAFCLGFSCCDDGFPVTAAVARGRVPRVFSVLQCVLTRTLLHTLPLASSSPL